MPTEEMVAVITGDINGYSKLPEEDARQLESVLRECYEKTSEILKDAGLRAFTIFRGDSWQFVVTNPVLAIRTALLFRAFLLVESDRLLGIRLHTSTAIGFGTIRFMPDSTSLAGGGQAYELSGKRLDNLHRRTPGIGVSGLGEMDQYIDCLLGVIDVLVRKWTALQSKAVSFAFQGLVQAEIATMWDPPITQQTVNRHLQAAGWQAVESAINWMETVSRGCISRNSSLGLYSQKHTTGAV